LTVQSIPDAQISEQELINRILAGERKLFHELIRPYERSIFVAAYAILRNHADAEEVAQDTVLKAFVHLNQLKETGKFKAWLMQIAVNQARLRRRNDRAHLYESLEGDEATSTEQGFMPRDFADWRDVPSDLLEQKEIREIIDRAIRELPEIYREVLMLRDIEELSVQETAKILSISETAAKVRLHRARLHLREVLAPVFRRRWTDRLPRWKGKRLW
jgi:RNA polymerase sigma-70 factor, ECF subfamily